MVDNYSKWIISYTDLDESLKKTKFNFIGHKLLFSENSIYNNLIQRSDILYRRVQVPNWHSFELDERDLTQQDFFSFFLADVPGSEMIFLLTDDADIHKDHAFKFLVSDFIEFSEFYEDYMSMDFFQFSLYVLVYSESNMIRFIDELGGINEFILT